MKKTVIALTLGLAALIAMPVSAQTENTCPAQKENCQKECKKDKKECKKDDCKKDCKKKDCKKKDCKKNDCKKECNKDRKDCKMNRDCKQPCMRDGKMGKMNVHKKEMRGGERVNPGMRDIALTPEQQQKYEALNQNFRQEMKETRGKGKQEMQKLHENYDAQLAEILTPEQLTQYKANRAKVKEIKGERKAGRMIQCNPKMHDTVKMSKECKKECEKESKK